MNISTVIKSLVEQPDRGYVLVAGLGVSGAAIVRFLRSKNLEVRATDTRPLGPDVTLPLEAMGVRCETGGHKVETFERAALIVTSPGIPLDMEYFKRARAKGVLVTGELDLFSFFNKKTLVAITGTNGKTTVTTLVSEMLEKSGLSVFTGGNIGTPLVEFLESGQEQDVVVAEVSSFQLDAATVFSPSVAVLLNLAEDHLDRYPDFSAYADSKWSIFRSLSERGFAVVNQNLEIPSGLEGLTRTNTLIFGTNENSNADISSRTIEIKIPGEDFTLDLSATRLRGAHNRDNIAAAALAAVLAGGNKVGIQEALNDFSPLVHRTEFVAIIHGVEYYNDSKGTNPHAVEGALQGFDRVILILGGRSKDTNFSSLLPVILQRVKAVVVMGEAAPKIKADLCGAPGADPASGSCSGVRIFDAVSMVDALEVAAGLAVTGDTVLLSPGCSSFDMYENYGQRGDDFKARVMALKGEDL
ncbi:MAG: UDP-N-acetylmuramoyl-L-alanine--D-glutamate ligase [Desulfobacterium sp.]|jgi:UDP-N-acetylmuramoylalanine--D-glutamate ligase|nr:UDP-N-acetylmuramoyl-L-alanine--D-glutamate ligase [Desulfobacterium sp.]